jgi:hypothetical protein
VSEHNAATFPNKRWAGVARCSIVAIQQVVILTQRSATLNWNLLSTWQNADEYIPISLLSMVVYLAAVLLEFGKGR